MRFIGLGHSNLERRARSMDIDLLIFASPNHLSVGLQSIPSVLTCWDFGHLDLPWAVETSTNGRWAWREELYRNSLQRAVRVICDSESTKKRLINLYSVPANRIAKLGLLPSVQQVMPIQLKKPHLIYPAMFWPHKNHRTLLEAFQLYIEKRGRTHLLVLTGDGKNKSAMENLADDLGIRSSVVFPGLVSREELLGLIKGSDGLLMPSLLGPSNLPQLEAALLGIPAVISDVHEMEDLLKGATLVEALSASSWAEALEDLAKGKVSVSSTVNLDTVRIMSDLMDSISFDLRNWL